MSNLKSKSLCSCYGKLKLRDFTLGSKKMWWEHVNRVESAQDTEHTAKQVILVTEKLHQLLKLNLKFKYKPQKTTKRCLRTGTKVNKKEASASRHCYKGKCLTHCAVYTLRQHVIQIRRSMESQFWGTFVMIFHFKLLYIHFYSTTFQNEMVYFLLH